MFSSLFAVFQSARPEKAEAGRNLHGGASLSPSWNVWHNMHSYGWLFSIPALLRTLGQYNGERPFGPGFRARRCNRQALACPARPCSVSGWNILPLGPQKNAIPPCRLGRNMPPLQQSPETASPLPEPARAGKATAATGIVHHVVPGRMIDEPLKASLGGTCGRNPPRWLFPRTPGPKGQPGRLQCSHKLQQQ